MDVSVRVSDHVDFPFESFDVVGVAVENRAPHAHRGGRCDGFPVLRLAGTMRPRPLGMRVNTLFAGDPGRHPKIDELPCLGVEHRLLACCQFILV